MFEGAQPPHDLDAERAVLGAILIDDSALPHVRRCLTAGTYFYLEQHRLIYDACLALQDASGRVDSLLLANYLRDHAQLERVGGMAFLSGLVDAPPDVANATHYAEIVHKKAKLRGLLAVSQSINEGVATGRSTSCQIGDQARRDIEALDLESRSREPIGVPLSDIEPDRVAWLWFGRIPQGKLTLLEGDPGVGKSLITLDLAARVSVGDTMPDGSPGIGRPAGVVLVCCEDGLADTVRPRVDAHAGDPERFLTLSSVGNCRGEPTLLRLPDNLAELRQAVERCSARLVIIDPLSAFLSGRIDSHRDTDVRAVLAQLAHLAESKGVAIVAVRHLCKSQDRPVLYRGIGSIAHTAAARVVLLVGRHPENPDVRVVAAVKSNLCRPPQSLEFEVDDTAGAPRIHWRGESCLKAEDLLAAHTARSRGDERARAIEFLRELLADGPMQVSEVNAEAEMRRISPATLRRASIALPVVREKVGGPNDPDRQHWLWSLPAEGDHVHTEGAHELRAEHLHENCCHNINSYSRLF
jgi:archaellum biogenesis ATPase FlaH